MNLKAGIITHFHKSENYGGLLQAYALCRFFSILGVEAEQISYDRTKENTALRGLRRRFVKMATKKAKLFAVGTIKTLKNISYPAVAAGLKKRSDAIKKFRTQMIPHTEKVYSAATVRQANDLFDFFVTGSDQVWHPQAVCSAYLLDFVCEKPRFSYAASLSCNQLSEQIQKRFSKSLARFNGISVREEEACELLSACIEQPVTCSLDPVFLLSREEWENVCSERVVAEAYAFCYFLGNNAKSRAIAKEFAKTHGLKLINLPHLGGKVKNNDIGFADLDLYEVHPGDFVSLIKHAECVFTDSFHASAFSSIYQKEYFVYEREENAGAGMGSRIKTLNMLFESEARCCFLQERVSSEYIESVFGTSFPKAYPNFEERKEQSVAYLRQAIECVGGENEESD